MSTGAGFDRLRRRTAEVPRTVPVAGVDADGKRALFSTGRPHPVPATALEIICSRCGETTAAGARQALRALAPSLHLPLLRRDHPSFLRCPACERLSWVRLRLRV